MKNSQENLESLIEAINELLNEVRKEQIMENKNAEKRHKACMQNLSKLREYNKIADMTNQIFEKRISNIENALQKILLLKLLQSLVLLVYYNNMIILIPIRLKIMKLL